jgi:hypothetical protein
MLPISSSEDCHEPSCLLVPARGVPLPLSGAVVASWLALSSAFPCTSRQETSSGPPSAQATHPGRLPRLSSRLHFLVGCRAGVSACASLARGEKPPGRTRAREHQGVRLPQSAVPVLRHHR